MNGRFDLLWSRFVRVASFFAGLAIMGYETGWDRQEKPWLYAAAVGMMGLPFARAAENILSRFSTSEQPIHHPEGKGE